MKTPDWEFWLDFDQVEAWQAVALSLNVDPDGLEHWEYQLKPLPDSKEIAERFNKRARRLSRRIIYDFKTYGGRAATYGYDTSSLPLHDLIKLSDFATWAQKRPWSMPEKLSALARDSMTWSEMALSHVEDESKNQIFEPESDNRLSESEQDLTPNLLDQREGNAELTKREKHKWGEHELRRLLSESRESEMTHQKLADKYDVSRQFISRKLTAARNFFGIKKATPFDSAWPRNRK